MKAKTKYFILSASSAAFWGTWSLAYHLGTTQGYNQGARDEFYCWKQEPIKLGSSWDGKLIGRRDAFKPPGGRSVAEFVHPDILVASCGVADMEATSSIAFDR